MALRLPFWIKSNWMFLWLYGATGSQSNHRVFRLCGTWALYYCSLYYWWENHFHQWWGLWLNGTSIPVACGTGCLWLPSFTQSGKPMDVLFNLCQLNCVTMATSNQWQEILSLVATQIFKPLLTNPTFITVLVPHFLKGVLFFKADLCVWMILNTILQKKFDLTLFDMIQVLIFHISDLYINVEKCML